MPNPELMAIGDSVYNGIRSLTIDKVRAEMAVPAQVARAFNWAFTIPDYPNVVLADLEDCLARLRDGQDPLETLPAAARNNGLRWLDGAPWSDRPVFHNVAIGQLATRDLIRVNHRDALATARALLQSPTLSLGQLPALYQGINTAFVLHPVAGGRDDRTPIDIVAEEKPKRLLVHVGPNDGLWTLLLQGVPGDFHNDLFDHDAWTNLAAAINAKCADVEHIYVNLLPCPRTVANIIPQSVDETRPNSLYYRTYISALLNMGNIPGATMEAIDQFIAETLNPGIKLAFAPLGPRVHFVDLYARSLVNDFKHFAERPEDKIELKVGEVQHISNYPLNLLGPGIGYGGLYSLDNLHPSAVGYGVVAGAVCKAIADTEGINITDPIDLQSCADSDPVLSHPPRPVTPAIGLGNLRTFAKAFIAVQAGTV